MQQSVVYISYLNILAILLLAFNLLIVFRHHVGAIFVPKTPQQVLLPFRVPFFGKSWHKISWYLNNFAILIFQEICCQILKNTYIGRALVKAININLIDSEDEEGEDD